MRYIIYIIYNHHSFFRYPPGGGGVPQDHRLIDAPRSPAGGVPYRPGRPGLSLVFMAVFVRQSWNYGIFQTLSVIITNDYPETTHKPPSNATKLCICCVGLSHCLNPTLVTGTKHNAYLRRRVLLSRWCEVVRFDLVPGKLLFLVTCFTCQSMTFGLEFA